MFGIPLGLTGGYMAASGSPMPNNSPQDMQSLLDALKATRAANAIPNGRVARGFAQFGPQPTGNAPPMLPTPPTPPPVDMGTPPALSAQAQAPQAAPAPWQGPHSVGGAPISMGPTSVGGAPLGAAPPSYAPTPQASGPDVINKLLAFFHQKGADYEMPKSENGGG